MTSYHFPAITSEALTSASACYLPVLWLSAFFRAVATSVPACKHIINCFRQSRLNSSAYSFFLYELD